MVVDSLLEVYALAGGPLGEDFLPQALEDVIRDALILNVHVFPSQVRHGTPDARLLTEITYAGGFTSYEGGGISYAMTGTPARGWTRVLPSALAARSFLAKMRSSGMALW